MAGQIDSGFRGQYFVAIYNGNPIPLVISKQAEKVIATPELVLVPYTNAICQFAIESVPKIKWHEIPNEEIIAVESVRGVSMLGASGKWHI